MVHYLNVNDHQTLQLELEAWALSQEQQTIVSQEDAENSYIKSDAGKLHLIWKSPAASLDLVEGVK